MSYLSDHHAAIGTGDARYRNLDAPKQPEPIVLTHDRDREYLRGLAVCCEAAALLRPDTLYTRRRQGTDEWELVLPGHHAGVRPLIEAWIRGEVRRANRRFEAA